MPLTPIKSRVLLLNYSDHESGGIFIFSLLELVFWSISDVCISSIVAVDTLGHWHRGQHVSSGRWLVWIVAKTQKTRFMRQFFYTHWPSTGQYTTTHAYTLSSSVPSLQANSRHAPPMMERVADAQPMYKPSPISYLWNSHIILICPIFKKI